MKESFLCCLLAAVCVLLPAAHASADGGEADLRGETVAWTDTEETAEILFSENSGVFTEEELTVVLKAPEGFRIAYTTDGSKPAPESDSGASEVSVTLNRPASYLIDHREAMIMPEFVSKRLYEDEELPGGAVLTACLVREDGVLSEPAARIYFLGVDFEERFPGCLVLSVYTDPDGLLDYETGILATGAVYDEWRLTEDAQTAVTDQAWWNAQTNSTQRGRDWERSCLLQIYDSGGPGGPASESAGGMRVRGGLSRGASQKSFNFYFRKEYGGSRLEYGLFPGEDHYKGFVLRAGGNTWNNLKFKDTMLQELAADRDVMVLQSRPAVLFLNGEYWGPYCLNEKLSAETMESRWGVDKDLVVIIKDGQVEEGTEEDLLLYQDLLAFAERDLQDPAVYEEFCAVMDVQSMADYFAVRIYIGDGDWAPYNNDVLWRTRDGSFRDGRWQYVLYDTEFSSGLYGGESTSAETDHFLLARERFPLFAAVLRNEDFRQLFTDAIREIGSVNYAPDRVHTMLVDYSRVWEPLMPDFYRRFGDSADSWDDVWDKTSQFFDTRNAPILSYVESWDGN